MKSPSVNDFIKPTAARTCCMALQQQHQGGCWRGHLSTLPDSTTSKWRRMPFQQLLVETGSGQQLSQAALLIRNLFFFFFPRLYPSSTLAVLFCYFSFSLHFVRTSKGVRTHARTHTHFLSHSYMCIERKMLIKSPTE